MTSKTTLLNKMSIKSVVGKIRPTKEVIIQEDGKDIKTMVVEDRTVARIVGLSGKYETGESDFGPWVAFRGTFEATRHSDGQTFRSSKLFLPDVASGLLQGAIDGANGGEVEFAFDIGVVGRPDLAIGYEYQATPLFESKENDPIAALTERVAAAAPLQLSAPADQEKSDKKK